MLIPDKDLGALVGHAPNDVELAAALRKQLSRGDFKSFRRKLSAQYLLWQVERRIAVASGGTTDGLLRRQTIAAERAALAAFIAVGVSLVSLAVSMAALFKVS